jgi:hypothetical protein
MRMKWTNIVRCCVALYLMSGLVACGSLAHCFNSGFAAVACGGGYGGSHVSSVPQPTATSAEGLWRGTTPTGRTVRALVLDDGSYWVFYTARDNPNILSGLIQGTGTSHFGSFESSNTRAFHVEDAGIRAGTMRGTYVQKNNFNGTIAYWRGGTSSFTSTYNPDYERVPNMNVMVGSYSGRLATSQTVTVTVSLDGTLSGHSTDGCTFTGSFSPRAKGNVFHVAVTFGGGPCGNGTDTVNGVAFYDAATRRLYSAALDNFRTYGFIFVGMRL